MSWVLRDVSNTDPVLTRAPARRSTPVCWQNYTRATNRLGVECSALARGISHHCALMRACLGQLRETASAHMTTDPSRVGAVALRASGISTERSYEIAVCAFGRTHLR